METIYDYLDEFGFSKPKRVERVVVGWRRNDFEAFLRGYAELVTRVSQIMRHTAGSIELFTDGWADPVPVRMIRQFSLYADTLYVHDPILNYIYELQTIDLNPANLIQYPDPEARIALLLGRFVATVQEVLQVKPLVSAGIIQFVPTQLIGRPKDPRAVYADNFYGPKGSANDLAGGTDPIDELPKAIRDYDSSKLYVRPVRIVNGQQKIDHTEKLFPTRMIAVGFPGDPGLKIFNLFAIKTMDNETRNVGMHLDYRDEGEPPDSATFENWVRGSKNNVLVERLNILQRDLYLAAFTGARLLTNLPTSHELARLNLDQTSSVSPDEEAAIYSVIQASLPYFGNVTETQIAKARSNEASFYDFRVALRKAISEVGCAGKQFNQAQVDAVVQDMLLTPIARVEARMKALRRNIFVDGVMLAGTLAATFLTGGNTLTAAAAILVAKQTLSDYRVQKAEEDKVKESPGFFYWDVTKKSRA